MEVNEITTGDFFVNNFEISKHYGIHNGDIHIKEYHPDAEYRSVPKVLSRCLVLYPYGHRLPNLPPYVSGWHEVREYRSRATPYRAIR